MPKMKKITKTIIGMILVIVILYSVINYEKVNFTLISFVIAFLIIALFFGRFESRKPNAKDSMPIAVMCTCATVGRAIFSFIPQIQPVTVIVIVMGVCFGSQIGFVTGALSALISNMILGQGVWTIWQMLGWGIVGLISGIFKDKRLSDNVIFMSILSFVLAFLYGFITDFWTIAFLSSDGINKDVVLGVYAASIPFDLMHGIGNVIFCLILYHPLKERLIRIRTKYGVGVA